MCECRGITKNLPEAVPGRAETGLSMPGVKTWSPLSQLPPGWLDQNHRLVSRVRNQPLQSLQLNLAFISAAFLLLKQAPVHAEPPLPSRPGSASSRYCAAEEEAEGLQA